jgi:hypothetical protein
VSDEIPAVEVYRGVGIDDMQSHERIEHVVKPAIDEVFGMTNTRELLNYCGDITKPPEGRLFAAAKLQAGFQMAAAGRVERPNVDLQVVNAMIAGLGSRRWRSPWGYGSLLDVPAGPGQRGHDPRPDEFRQQIEADRRRV